MLLLIKLGRMAPLPEIPRRFRKKKSKKAKSVSSDDKWMKETYNEREARRMEDFKQMEHKLLSQSWIMYDLKYGISLSEFVKTLDVLQLPNALNNVGSTIQTQIPQ